MVETYLIITFCDSFPNALIKAEITAVGTSLGSNPENQVVKTGTLYL